MRNRRLNLCGQCGTVTPRHDDIAATAQQLRLPLHPGDGDEHS